MKIKFSHFLSLTLLFLTASCHDSSAVTADGINPLQKVQDWFILLDYSQDSVQNYSELRHFDMAILDPDAHPPLDLLEDSMILIAYISLGEAESYRFYWEKIKGQSWIVGENSNWNENYLVDVRSAAWKDLMIQEVIPRIVHDGFDGLFLDTLDTAAELEDREKGEYQGVSRAMIDLVRSIHKTYPDLLLISNNGFTILDEIGPYLSGFLTEDIHWRVDFEKDDYIAVLSSQREFKVNILKSHQKKFNLPVFNIDYVSSKERDTVLDVIKRSRKLGFVPYVAEKNLSKIYFRDAK